MSKFQQELLKSQKRAKKRNIALFIIISVLALVAFFTIYQNISLLSKLDYQLKGENNLIVQLEHETQLLKDSLAAIRKTIDPIEDELDTISITEKSNLISLDSILNRMDENSRYYIRLGFFNPNEDIKLAIELKLSNIGYNVRTYPTWPEKPNFFADLPTIFYYSDKTQSIALEIELLLKEQLNLEFKVAKGAGYGISKEDINNTFVIHYME